MPPFEAFRDAEAFYGTLAHETTHWTGARSRLDRDLSSRFGSHAYAAEELVAELGSAFLCADLGLTPEPRPDHASYIENWLRVLKNDKRAIFIAAAHAERAAAFLRGLQPASHCDRLRSSRERRRFVGIERDGGKFLTASRRHGAELLCNTDFALLWYALRVLELTMSQVTQSISERDLLLNRRRSRYAALLVTCFFCIPHFVSGQAAATAQAQETPALTGPLERADAGTQLHILYVHGMGINTPKHKDGTQDFEVSQEFRTNFCKMIGCTTKMGELVGRNYADEADFAPNADPPSLSYLGQDVWNKSTKEEWRAAAPFVDHYRLVRKDPRDPTNPEKGTPIYLDEINWWPLILSAKCRQIVGPEAALVDRDKKHIANCSAKTVQDSDHKDRYKSFSWISNDQKHDPSWPEPAVINRYLKHDILDWGFADALLAVGPLRQYLIEGIREIVLHSFDQAENQEFVVVTHSLGSYLMFSALDLQDDPHATAHADWKAKFETLLGETSHAYFMANQVRLLELANLDNTKNGNLIKHLQDWYAARHRAQQRPPQIVAWSDPDDLLTWKIPDLDQNAQGVDAKPVTVQNRPAQNAWRWFWLLESPADAHANYDQNKRVLRAMVPKSKARPTTTVNGAKPMAPASP